MRKKAQIKFGESIGVIIIVYIIIMVGMIWFNSINNSDIQQTRNDDLKNKAFEKYFYVINLDLIHQSQEGDVKEEFNLNSLIAFTNYSKTQIGKKYLKKRLGEATITLDVYSREELLNGNIPSKKLVLYNVTPAKNKDITNTDLFRSLIPVHDEINKTNEIGILKITNYITAQR